MEVVSQGSWGGTLTYPQVWLCAGASQAAPTVQAEVGEIWCDLCTEKGAPFAGHFLCPVLWVSLGLSLPLLELWKAWAGVV